MTMFVALGDSITVGVGDPVPPGCPAALAGRAGSAEPPGRHAWRGWAALLADGLREPGVREPGVREPGVREPGLREPGLREPGPRGAGLRILAVSGACAADVERDQLPQALKLGPDIASVVVGVNDTLRANFDLDRVAAATAHTVSALRAAGAEVLTMRLPDPGRMLGVPGILARPLARRTREVNLMLDAVAERYGTVHFDAAGDAETYDPRMWAVDRLHPSERGHRLIARRFHALLGAAGHPIGPPPDAEPVNPPPTRRAEFAWLATKGTGWVVRRSTDLVPGLAALAIAEWRSARALPPGQPDGPRGGLTHREVA